MELCPPFEGWTLDHDGIIHTPSGYRCTPQQIEAAMWMCGMLWRSNELGARLIFADTPMVEPRRLGSLKDWQGENLDRLRAIAKRGRCERRQHR